MKIRDKAAGIFVLSLFWAMAGAAAADTPGPGINAILETHGCSSCHAQSEQIVGPSFDDVRRRYGSRPDALSVLVPRVRSGGGGRWGQLEMPPNPNISDRDLRAVLSAILNGAPSGARPAGSRR